MKTISEKTCLVINDNMVITLNGDVVPEEISGSANSCTKGIDEVVDMTLVHTYYIKTKKMVWEKKNNDKWLLKVNSKISVELANYCGSWTIWLNKNEKVKISALHGLCDDIVDAKTEGLKIAQKILEEEKENG